MWHLSGKFYYKYTMTDVEVWLSCYLYIFAISTYLTRVSQCLTIFLFQKVCVFGKISIRLSGKKHQTIKKVELSKMQTVNPLFKQMIVYA